MATGKGRGTDRSNAAQQIAQNRLRVADMCFEHSISCLVILDRNFNFVRVNAAYARACRRGIDEFAGRNHFDLYPSDAKGIFEEVVRTKRPFETNARAFVFPDQPERDVTYWDWTLVPLFDQKGEVEYLIFSLNDVTERKRAEQSAIANEQRLRLALQKSNMAVFHQDQMLRYTWMFQPQLGYSPEQVIGHTDLELLPAEAARQVTDLKQSVLQTGDTVHAEVPVRAGDTTFYYDLLAEPMRNGMGRIIGITGVTLDITERKRAEDALRDSEEQLREIFEESLDGILVADVETKTFLTANPAVCSILGYSSDEILRIGVTEIHPPKDLPYVLAEFERMRNGEVQVAIDIPLLRKNGSVCYADIKASRIQLAGRECLLGIFSDVTERREANQLLVESEERYRGLVEQSIAGIYMIQDGRFVYVNPRFAQILGYARAEELIGRDAIDVAVEQDRSKVLDLRRALIEDRARSCSFSFTGLKKDGTTVEVGVHGARAIHGGRSAVIGLLQDISEKRRAEEQIGHYIGQLESAFMSTVKVAMNLGAMRDPYTAGHQLRVAELAVAIGIELEFQASRQEGLRVAGYLHDIGKITIPSEILSKPGRLNEIEYKLIQGHPQAGYDVLKSVEFPWPVARVALEHHERMDGTGYPRGIKDQEILLEARIMAVADVVEAMSSHRPYRPGLGIAKALAEIEGRRGTAYDADVVDACLRVFRERQYQFSE